MTLPVAPLDPNSSIRQILAEPAFKNMRPNDTPADFWGSFWAWVGQQIGHLLRGMIASVSGNTGVLIGDLLIGAALVGIVILVCHLLMAFVLRRSEVHRVVETAVELRARTFMERAQAAADAGNYSEAIAMLFSASLASFDEKGVVAYDAARTPWEYERILQIRHSSLTAPFQKLARSFVGIAFAADGATRTDYDEALGAVASIQAAAA